MARCIAAHILVQCCLAATITPQSYAVAQHVVVSRKGRSTGPVDDALEALGLRRDVIAVVPGFPDAMRIASQSDLVALIPRSCLGDPFFAQG